MILTSIQFFTPEEKPLPFKKNILVKWNDGIYEVVENIKDDEFGPMIVRYETYGHHKDVEMWADLDANKISLAGINRF